MGRRLQWLQPHLRLQYHQRHQQQQQQHERHRQLWATLCPATLVSHSIIKRCFNTSAAAAQHVYSKSASQTHRAASVSSSQSHHSSSSQKAALIKLIIRANNEQLVNKVRPTQRNKHTRPSHQMRHICITTDDILILMSSVFAVAVYADVANTISVSVSLLINIVAY